MRILLISNSTNAGEGFLEHARGMIQEFAGGSRPHAVFVPYAAVSMSFEAYSERVRGALSELGIDCSPVPAKEDPVAAIAKAEMIVVGGGNTFHLLQLMQTNGLLEAIRKRVRQGIPYLGWSAGANVACPTICTTNDMPIIELESFGACKLVPFQINPHYLDANPAGHAGESREQRIMEYIEVNRDRYVVGLREGTALKLERGVLELIGSRKARVFKYGLKPMELGSGEDFSFLLK